MFVFVCVEPAQVVAPCKCKGTQKWISFSALNSERRKEPVKWKNCPTCQVWPVSCFDSCGFIHLCLFCWTKSQQYCWHCVHCATPRRVFVWKWFVLGREGSNFFIIEK